MTASTKSRCAVLLVALTLWVFYSTVLAADSCVLPDNGIGTATLPPIGCQYTCPDVPFMVIDGLPPGTTIEMDGILKEFICCDSQCTNCSLPLVPGECETSGGTLGGYGHCFEATLELHCTGTGDLLGFSRTLSVPVTGEVHTGPRNPGDPVQDFAATFYRLQGELFGDPDFCTFRVAWGDDYGLPGPGHTTLTELPNGDFNVDSFFDITYQIEFEGCPGSPLEDYLGITTATTRLETGFVHGHSCRPMSDGSACVSGTCPEIGYECVPSCVKYDLETGQTTVIECECRPTGDCQIEIPPVPASTCVLPSDSCAGAVTLPPIGCEYRSPDEVFVITEGLPPDTTIELAPILMDFICCGGQCDNCSVLLGDVECEIPGGPLGGHIDCFSSTLDLTVSGTGDLLGFNRHLSLTGSGEVHTGPRNPGDPIQAFETDFYSYESELFGDPDFCEFRIYWGIEHALPSPGHTTLTELPTGDFAVDSFFDITYRIEFEGCPGSPLEDMSGISEGTIRMTTGGPLPGCVGEADPWMICCGKMNFDSNDGMLKVYCDAIEPSADLNRSGLVDIVDLAIMGRQWLSSGPQ